MRRDPAPASAVVVRAARGLRRLAPVAVCAILLAASQAPAAAAPTRTVAAPGSGSAAVGSTAYPVPAGAVFVAPNGSDGAAGGSTAPLRTVAAAIAKAPSGATIVLRSGGYHESVTIPVGKRLTVQAYPNEAAWFEGSSVVGSWAAAGTRWVSSGWTTRLDASPTYSRGMPDNTEAGWQFVNPAYPMAAHPDQVWIDGVAQRQVGSLGAVVAGTFFVDSAAAKLYLGSNPARRTVRASDLATAITVLGGGSVLRGFGVRRYAPSVPDMGTVRFSAAGSGSSVENVHVVDNATTGLSVASQNITLTAVTSANNGFLGIHSVYADGLVGRRVAVFDNNTERFNPAPAAGGWKITRSRNVSVASSELRDNYGIGLWFDESCYNVTVVGNRLTRNVKHGVTLELSAKAVVANNLVTGNGGQGIQVFNTDKVSIWNNTLVGNVSPIKIEQDSRRASNVSARGHDPRQPLPDPTVTWVITSAEVSNNVVAAPPAGASPTLYVLDKTRTRTGAQMGVRVAGNVYHRSATTNPAHLVRWPVGAAGYAAYPTLAAFRAATGAEATGREFTGASVVTSSGAPTAAVTSIAGSVAQPVPAAVAAVSGLTAGSRVLGATLG